MDENRIEDYLIEMVTAAIKNAIAEGRLEMDAETIRIMAWMVEVPMPQILQAAARQVESEFFKLIESAITSRQLDQIEKRLDDD
ncbi:hypothetical protein ACMHYT_30310 [Rhodococcus qingshengii]|uniref:hypothetical protein n=1 Tax=Rhodococcus qingshengii TaxID=334542 RepID=UPI0039C4D79F